AVNPPPPAKREDLNARLASLIGQRPSPLSALHLAAEGGHADVVKVLLAHKAEVNARGLYNRTPLHCLLDGAPYTAHLGQLEVMPVGSPSPAPAERLKTGRREQTLQHLLDHGADVNAVDRDGHTPLYYALRHLGASELPGMLIRKGAELTLLD